MLAKVRGWQCRWPVVVWSMRLCLRKDLEQVLESHKPGRRASCRSSGRHHHALDPQCRLSRPHQQEHSRASLLKAFSPERGFLPMPAHVFAWENGPAR